MLRTILLLAVVLGASLGSGFLLSSHCKHIREQHKGNSSAQVAASVKVPVDLFHEVERYAVGICALCAVGLFALSRHNAKTAEIPPWKDATQSALQVGWLLTVLATMLTVLAVYAYTIIGQGYEQRAGISPALNEGFNPILALEFISLCGIMASLCIGPPGGWNGKIPDTWW